MSIYKETIKRYLVGGKAEATVSRTAVLDLAQFYSDCASLGATVDITLVENSLKALPLVARNEAIPYLVPGAYKSGMVYGFNSDTRSVLDFPFSRATSGTYIDKNGVLQTAVPNMPRIDYDPATGECRGYLCEPASLNLTPWSNDFTKRTQSGAGTAVITSDFGNTPDGLKKSNKIKFTGAKKLFDTMQLEIGKQYTLSVFAKCNTACSFQFSYGLNSFSELIVLSPVWKRYWLTFTATEVSNQIGIYSSITTPDIEFGLSQSEEGDLTSYIPTSGAVAIRAKDNIEAARNFVYYPSASVFLSFVVPYLGDSVPALILSSDTQKIWDSELITAATVIRVMSAFGESDIRLSINGSSVESENYDGSIPGGLLKFNSRHSRSSICIKAMAVIPRKLTDSEILTATI